MGNKFSIIDLTPFVRRHLLLLHRVRAEPGLVTDVDKLYVAVKRYKNFLYLRANGYQVTELPLDVEWIWHVHMMHPVDYYTDCMNLFGKVVALLGNTGKPIIPKYYSDEFDLNERECPDDVRRQTHDLILSIDLVQGSLRHKKFLDAIEPFFKVNKSTLHKLIEQYLKWLKLVRKYADKGIVLVPTIGIDLIWHTHMRLPEFYQEDVVQAVGFFLDHHDDIAEEELKNGIEKTGELWKQTYKKEYFTPAPYSSLTCAVPIKYFKGPFRALQRRKSSISSYYISSCGGSWCGGGQSSCGVVDKEAVGFCSGGSLLSTPIAKKKSQNFNAKKQNSDAISTNNLLSNKEDRGSWWGRKPPQNGDKTSLILSKSIFIGEKQEEKEKEKEKEGSSPEKKKPNSPRGGGLNSPRGGLGGLNKWWEGDNAIFVASEMI